MFYFTFRTLVAQGDKPISADTLLRDINRMYSALGFSTKVGGKSAKVLGVSLAFSAGLTSEQVRILGRWASAETARHYYNVSNKTILDISSTLTLATMHLDCSNRMLRQKGTLQESMIQHGPLVYVQHKEVQERSTQLSEGITKEATCQSSVVTRSSSDLESVPVSAPEASPIPAPVLQPAFTRIADREELTPKAAEAVPLISSTVSHNSVQRGWVCTLTTGCWKEVLSLDSEGFPMVDNVPYVRVPGDEDLVVESVSRFTVKVTG